MNTREKIFTKLYTTKYPNEYTQADCAIQAGYSPNGAAVTASRLLKRPKIIEYINYLQEKRVISADYTRNDIASNLVDIATLSLQDKEYHASIRANELLGKDIGMFKQELQVSGALGVVFIGEGDLKD